MGKTKAVDHTDLDWLTSPFSKRPDQFDNNDWQNLHHSVDWTSKVCESHDEYMTKAELYDGAIKWNQPVFDIVRFRTPQRFRALRVYCRVSLDDLADILGVTRATATKYERDGFKDGLRQNQIDAIVDHFADVLYHNNITPTYAESVRFMIRANDPTKEERAEWNNEVLEALFDKEPIDSNVADLTSGDRKVFLKTPKDTDHSKMDAEVLIDRSNMLKNVGNDLAMMLAENVEEINKIHYELLGRYLGENLRDKYMSPNASASINEASKEILESEGFTQESFRLTERNRLSVLNVLYKYSLPEYPICADELFDDKEHKDIGLSLIEVYK